MPVPRRLSLPLGYAVVRRFHAPASAVMVATATIEEALRARGFHNIRRWSRGVDTEMFRPRDKAFLAAPRPVFALCRPGRGREEPRRFPQARPSGHQICRRR